jgi:DtxR family Mn-dependent transcriptional regulator
MIPACGGFFTVSRRLGAPKKYSRCEYHQAPLIFPLASVQALADHLRMMFGKKLSASLEDYLEAIYHIVREKQAAKVRDIARRLAVSSSSVTGALRALDERELVNYAPYDVITLTDKGAREARKVVRRHSALRDFLTGVLAVSYAKADEVACRMEHALEGEVLERLIRFLEFAERCPRAGAEWLEEVNRHCSPGGSSCLDEQQCAECFSRARTSAKKEPGEIAPLHRPGVLPTAKTRTLKKEPKSVQLVEVKAGAIVKISRVIGGGRGFQERLNAMGLLPGTVLTVMKNSGRGPFLVDVKGSRLALGRSMAQKIIVE